MNIIEANKVIVERYVIENHNYQNLIVGSSISQGLPLDEKGLNISSLALTNGNAVTGLEVIYRSKKAPKNLYIEINSLVAKSNLGLYYDLESNLLDFNFKMRFLEFREANKPLKLLFYIVQALSYKIKSFIPKTAIIPDKKPNYENLKKETIRQRLNIHDKPPGEELIERLNKLDTLIGLILDFSSETNMFLFEAPMEESLLNSQQHVFIREYCFDLIDKYNLETIELTKNIKYEFVDGVHLTPSSAGDFLEELAKKIK